MKKKNKFRRGQLIQNQCNDKIYIYVKSAGKGMVHLIELNDAGQPLELITSDIKYFGPLKLIPKTFKQIDITL